MVMLKDSSGLEDGLEATHYYSALRRRRVCVSDSRGGAGAILRLPEPGRRAPAPSASSDHFDSPSSVLCVLFLLSDAGCVPACARVLDCLRDAGGARARVGAGADSSG